MTRPTRRTLSLSILAFVALAALLAFGCSSDDGGYDGPIYDGDEVDGDISDGDSPDGDIPDGDSPDGDNLPDGDDQPEDGDEPEDGDVPEDGDEPIPTTGSIRGVLRTSGDLAENDVEIKLFSSNPFENWGVEAVASVTVEGAANRTESPFLLDEVPTGRYYMWAYINVGNDENAGNDVFNVYPRVITLVAQDPELRHVTGADIYINAPNPNLGSIAGTLHSSEAYMERRVMMVTSRVVENEDGADLEYWPSSVVFLEPGANAARPYLFSNLFDGSYYTFAYVSTGETTPPLAYGTPYDPLTIEVGDSEKKEYTGEVFYLGLADPNFCSISGNIILPVALTGELGVYVFSSKVEEDVTEVEPMALILVKNPGNTTTIPYVVGNLGTETDIWVAGGLQLGPEKIAFGYHEEALSVDLEDPTRKTLVGKHMNIPITEMSGTVTVTSNNDPGWARVVLADMTVNIMANPMITVNDYGGGTDVPLAAPARGTMTGDYVMFPVKGGSWSVVVVLDTDLVEGISDGDQWCFQYYEKKGLAPKITVDGTQLTITGRNITVNTTSGGGWLCSAAPAN